MGLSTESLSNEGRAAHYRQMAMEVARLAHKMRFPDAREQFVKLAESWLALADEIERKTASCLKAQTAAPDQDGERALT
jgi:hypothetical protein